MTATVSASALAQHLQPQIAAVVVMVAVMLWLLSYGDSAGLHPVSETR